MNIKYSKILIIRTDRLGDCILSTPVVSLLRNLFPEAAIDVLTTPYTYEVFSENPDVNKVMLDEKQPLLSSGFRGLIRRIRNEKYDACFILHLDMRAALVPFLAGIPVRVSPATKLYQFFSTARVTQKRSQCKMNESEYNLDLVKKHLGVEAASPETSLFFNSEAGNFAEKFINSEFLKKRGMDFTEYKKAGRKVVMVHPGCGGSARNMSVEKYVSVMEKIKAAGHEVFLSTGPAEKALRDGCLSKLSFTPLYYTDEIVKNGLNLKKTFAVISLCDAVVAPSTGIMHAAVALKKPVITIFCPIFVCAPERWGPAPSSTQKNSVIIPAAVSSLESNTIGGKYCKKCIKEKCAHYSCMEKIKDESVVDALTKAIQARP